MRFIASFGWQNRTDRNNFLLGSLFIIIIIIVDSYRVDKYDGQPGFGRKRFSIKMKLFFFVVIVVGTFVAAAAAAVCSARTVNVFRVIKNKKRNNV